MGAYSGMSRADLQAELTALRAARRSLVMGAQVAQASYSQGDGAKSVAYRPADIARLEMDIRQIEGQLSGRRVRSQIGIASY
jgi:hypothetical protein